MSRPAQWPTADILSTALYVLGPKDGLRWANSHQVAALFVSNEDELKPSETFRSLLSPL